MGFRRTVAARAALSPHRPLRGAATRTAIRRGGARTRAAVVPALLGLALLAALAGCAPKEVAPGPGAPPGAPQLHANWTSCAEEVLGVKQPAATPAPSATPPAAPASGPAPSATGLPASAPAGPGNPVNSAAAATAGPGGGPGGGPVAGASGGPAGGASGASSASSGGATGAGGADAGKQPPAWVPDDSVLRLPRLSEDFEPVGIVLCSTAARADGGGEAMFLDEMRGTDVEALVRAVRLADQPRTDDLCNLMLYTVPWFALLAADGSWVRPGVPADGCGTIRIEVRDAVRQLQLERVASTRLHTTISAGAAASGCGQSYADMVATELANGRPLATGGAIELPPADASVRLCVYAVPAGEQGSAKPGGQFDRGAVLPAATWAAIRAALPQPGSATAPLQAPAACTVHASRFAMLAPATAAGTPQVFVELDGCHRVLYVPATSKPTLAQGSPDLVRLLTQ
ncbi:hypothetical protein KZZ52_40590 [Dactylosporangium sp. AC04546]|uniref:hypothetical protein n=1 Tax=Dactylosporangium sp. AC04546 TaxID=2862460 RepID=UPI002E7B5A68|nr:hypothetical protein [Dactylosporangium sp. AC04546]WVK80245.1 hypothetical protein KZZ52_40590 [Dactylosporangium sp. AC04546]